MISEVDKIEMKRLRVEERKTQQEIATMFGVSRQYVHRVTRGIKFTCPKCNGPLGAANAAQCTPCGRKDKNRHKRSKCQVCGKPCVRSTKCQKCYGKSMRTFNHEAVALCYSKGATSNQLSRVLGIKLITICKSLSKAGVVMRGRDVRTTVSDDFVRETYSKGFVA